MTVVQGQIGEVLIQEEQYGLKPYIYYSCRYKNDSTINPFDFIVNYTLDNAIVIYGYIGDLGYKTVSGYMVGTNNLADETIETLYEKILVLDNNGLVNELESKEYEYYYNKDGIKIYKDDITLGTFDNDLFLYKNNKRIGIGTIDFTPVNSAKQYNDSFGTEFEEVINKIRDDGDDVRPVNEDGTEEINDVAFTGCSIVFDVNNNPEDPASDFTEHKRAIIQRSIKSNLYTAMANFSRNSTSSYQFRMPQVDETEWDKVVSNVGIIAFMQGIPMGNKYYNDYCIVSNNNNKEYVGEDSIYIIVKSNPSDKGTYHRIGCEDLQTADLSYANGYLNIDFRRQTVKGKTNKDDDGNLLGTDSEGNQIYYDKNYYYYPKEARSLL